MKVSGARERTECQSMCSVPCSRTPQVDKDLPGGSWIEIPKGKYSIREKHKSRSRCQIEVDVFFQHVRSFPCEGEWSKIAPIRILSFDIECAGRRGHFPEVM